MNADEHGRRAGNRRAGLWVQGFLACAVLLLLAWPVSFYRGAHAEYRFGALLPPGDSRGDPRWWTFRARRAFVMIHRGVLGLGISEYQSLAPQRSELSDWDDYGGVSVGVSASKPSLEPLIYWHAPSNFMFLGLGVVSAGTASQGARMVCIPLWGMALVLATGAYLSWRPAQRRARRAAANQCIHCGYSRAGVAAGAVCPECGRDGAAAGGPVHGG